MPDSLDLVPSPQKATLRKSFKDLTLRDLFSPGPSDFTATGRLRQSLKNVPRQQLEVAFSQIERQAQAGRLEVMSSRARRLI